MLSHVHAWSYLHHDLPPALVLFDFYYDYHSCHLFFYPNFDHVPGRIYSYCPQTQDAIFCIILWRWGFANWRWVWMFAHNGKFSITIMLTQTSLKIFNFTRNCTFVSCFEVFSTGGLWVIFIYSKCFCSMSLGYIWETL